MRIVGKNRKGGTVRFVPPVSDDLWARLSDRGLPPDWKAWDSDDTPPRAVRRHPMCFDDFGPVDPLPMLARWAAGDSLEWPCNEEVPLALMAVDRMARVCLHHGAGRSSMNARELIRADKLRGMVPEFSEAYEGYKGCFEAFKAQETLRVVMDDHPYCADDAWWQAWNDYHGMMDRLRAVSVDIVRTIPS